MKETLYVHRKVLNAAAILDWARDQGFRAPLSADDLHITQAFSRAPVCWSDVPPLEDVLILPPDTGRQIIPLGPEAEKTALVLAVTSEALQHRWQVLCAAGCAWDYPSYTPHISLSYQDDHLDAQKILPYAGEIILGGEVFQPLKPEWL